MKPIAINSSIAKTLFKIAGGCNDYTKAKIVITRVGKPAFSVVYPAFEKGDDGEIVFMWDSALYQMPEGRYEGILTCGDCRMCVPIVLHEKCKLLSNQNQNYQNCWSCDE